MATICTKHINSYKRIIHVQLFQTSHKRLKLIFNVHSRLYEDRPVDYSAGKKSD